MASGNPTLEDAPGHDWGASIFTRDGKPGWRSSRHRNMRFPNVLALVLTMASALPAARADVMPHPLFADHAVLQQGMPVPVWGTAAPGKPSRWRSPARRSPPRRAPTASGCPPGAHEGRWPAYADHLGQEPGCSRRHPRRRGLGGRRTIEHGTAARVAGGQQPIADWEKEVAAANHPQIRHFGVAQDEVAYAAGDRQRPLGGLHAGDREGLHGRRIFLWSRPAVARNVPVGLIHSSWGGTPAEAWTSERGCVRLPEFAETRPNSSSC